ncbi:MAG: hypothetical protein VKJ04_10370 [Vampirovibrionales bacterium]|nr:hypothetical protein [Vampirovibrionales bacterium]
MTYIPAGNYPGTLLYPPGTYLLSQTNRSLQTPPLPIPEPVMADAFASQLGTDTTQSKVTYRFNPDGTAFVQAHPLAAGLGASSIQSSLSKEQAQEAFAKAADTVLEKLNANNGYEMVGDDTDLGSLMLNLGDAPLDMTISSFETINIKSPATDKNANTSSSLGSLK